MKERPKLDYKILQRIILEKYGVKSIKEARERLCSCCVERANKCHLLPITTNGSDCPYFQKQEGVTA